ncbi:MAG: 5-formyltetrahydrofolate cyclo-ligase [Roseivirga sp.]|jgi:5-formyltetrahydrofolate cyclo-ligase
MNKEVLRSLFLEKRKTLTGQEFDRRNKLLLKNCLDFLAAHPQLIHCHLFLSIKKFKEPNTWPLFEHLRNSNAHKVYVSKTLFKQKRLTHFRIENDSLFETTKFGIPEPVNGTAIEPQVLDVVFVPLISCDKMGNRIGYGAGLYDRFLNEVSPNCLKVGIGITPTLDHLDFTDEHDVPLDYFISHLGSDTFDKS